MAGNADARRAVPWRVADVWTQVRRGAASPLLVVRRARAAGEPWRAYRRLVALHVVLAALIMGVAAPYVVHGVRVAAEREASPERKHDKQVAAAKERKIKAAVEKAAAGKKSTIDKAVAAAKAVKETAEADDSDDEKVEDEKPADDKAADTEGTVEAPKDDDDAPPSFLVTHAPSLIGLWVAIGSLYAMWIFIELAISMVWMEHLDRLTEQLTEAMGLPVRQPMLAPPRLRFSIRWALQKGWRQLLGALMIASGAPFFAVVLFIPKVGSALYAILLGAWTFYWFMVSTTAKSAKAWADPAPHAPWFLRIWTRTTTSTFGFRWFGPRWYGSLWTRLTHGLHPAAALLEDRPYVLAGLSLARLTAQLPFIALVVKPLLPTAAEVIVMGRLDEPSASDAPLPPT